MSQHVADPYSGLHHIKHAASCKALGTFNSPSIWFDIVALFGSDWDWVSTNLPRHASVLKTVRRLEGTPVRALDLFSINNLFWQVRNGLHPLTRCPLWLVFNLSGRDHHGCSLQRVITAAPGLPEHSLFSLVPLLWCRGYKIPPVQVGATTVAKPPPTW